MKSVWRQYLNNGETKSIDMESGGQLDTVIVGGGIAGIMCAYMLAKDGHKVTLLEAGKILEGVTSSTTAHVTALQGKSRDIPTCKKRRMYFESQQEAILGIESLVRESSIDCDFESVDGFVFGERKDLKKEYKVNKKFCSQLEYFESGHLPFGIHDCMRLPGQAQFNPVKFCQGLLGSFDIVENCRIKKVKLGRKELRTETQVFKYNRLIIATGYPIVNIRGLYAFKMYKSFSYAVCAKTSQKVDGIYNSIAGDGLTFRDSTDGILIGGLDHRTGRAKCNHYFDTLTQEAKKFDASPEHYKWAANDCMTFDYVPFAGRMFRCRRDVYLISGFGKWGMTNSFTCANIVCDCIAGRKNRYKSMFKPTRILNIAVWPSVLWNFLQDGVGLIEGLFSSGKRRCPHMGCRLKYNKNTGSYDCTCHGSRFTKDGDIIVSPAVDVNQKLK